MAPQKWSAERDQNLLLLIIKDIKPNFQDLAEKWARQFPNEDFKPTAKAVSEHVAALKRRMGGASGGSSVPFRSTPITNTPRAANGGGAPKTPTSKGKRSRAEMSNEDDSEDEKTTPVLKRTTPSRHAVPKKYKEEPVSSDAEDDEDELIMSSVSSVKPKGGMKPSATTNGHSPGIVDVDAPRRSIARSKSNPPKLGYFDRENSGEDVSDFEPFT